MNINYIIYKNKNVMLIGIQKASEYLGVSKSTLRRWEREGKITSIRTSGKHRKYDINQFKTILNNDEKIVVCYCRVSTREQIEDLNRQKERLEMYCLSKGYKYKFIEDVGSGMNYKKKGLAELIQLINNKEISKIILNYKDRLVRFGFEIIEELCKLNNVDIEIVNQTEDKSYQEELVDDVLSILTVYSSRLYGSRSHKAKNILKENKNLFKIDKK